MEVLLVGDCNVVHTRRYLDLATKAGCDVALLDTGKRDATKRGTSTHQYYGWPRSGWKIAVHFLGRSAGVALSDLLTGRLLRWLLTRVRPDIVHVQWTDDKAWLLAKASVSPLVLTAWGSDLNGTLEPGHDPVLRQRRAEGDSQMCSPDR